MIADTWNARYVAYASPLVPDERLRLDRKSWPGASMWPFMRWIDEHRRQWKANGRQLVTKSDHDDFTVWLQTISTEVKP